MSDYDSKAGYLITYLLAIGARGGLWSLGVSFINYCHVVGGHNNQGMHVDHQTS
jgi:hypothetical protein